MTLNFSPYSKTVIAAVGSLVTVVVQFLVGDGADVATLGTGIMGFLTTVGVYKVTNGPVPTSDAAAPSPHTITTKTPTSTKKKTSAKKGE